MVKLNKIYTRTGDDGTTGLIGGVRVPKHSARVDAYGDVDEANSAIGVARAHLTPGEHDAMLLRIQHDLFDVGADLATPGLGEKDLRILQTQVTRLEHEIDAMNAALKPLDSFVLPGGTPVAAQLHVARTVVRRAERSMTRCMEEDAVNPMAIHYINRLSDHLFVLARLLNDGGARDVLWQRGANR
ncbi:MAG: cob(I)yrinic acid a,c-diamide adenosyltransferase [Alphaproteobacteria bacterium]|nr:cob(I)yrinic acid a,c-diamide adenosyltransferase [Alphaproteobacteria bacterium]